LNFDGRLQLCPVYKGENDFDYKEVKFDPAKKTVIIIADHKGTEMFDMLAPFYLFNATEKANVYIVAEKKYPIVVWKGFCILPQLTFSDLDASHIKPDVMIIPNLSAMDAKHQDPIIVNWIKKYHLPETKVLSVCDGSLTAASTGIYDGSPITTHASDYSPIKKQFVKPLWVDNVSFTQNGNLFSTAGVSNAVEGSLIVINETFGNQTMKQLIKKINYPYDFPKKEHKSIAMNFNNKMAIVGKVLFGKNKKTGVLLHDGINEFLLAAVTDTYNRTFPKAMESYSLTDMPVKSEYGLTIIPSGKIKNLNLDELHIFSPASFSNGKFGTHMELIKYDTAQQQYIINTCLERINKLHGRRFEHVVKLMLDYN
jgi:putative intracellular protease/amidase